MKRAIYMRLTPHHSLRFDPAVHDYEWFLARGWVVYDPDEPGDSVCTDTHRRSAPRVVCKHGVSWWCSRAPRDNWWPEAPYQRDRALKAAAEGGVMGTYGPDCVCPFPRDTCPGCSHVCAACNTMADFSTPPTPGRVAVAAVTREQLAWLRANMESVVCHAGPMPVPPHVQVTFALLDAYAALLARDARRAKVVAELEEVVRRWENDGPASLGANDAMDAVRRCLAAAEVSE